MLKIKGKILLIVVFFLTINPNTFAQWALPSSQLGETSIYAGAGITKLYGDIGGYANEKFALVDINTSYALGFRYTSPFRVGFSLLAELNNHYQGDDVNTHLSYREIAFRSRQYGYSGQLEITLWGGNYFSTYNPHHLYAFGGIGHSNISSQILDTTLIRSTDKVKYKEQTWSIYGGFGYQYRFADHFSIGLEYRATQFLTDYIDGYHPKFSKRDDMSMDLRLTVAYYFHLNLGGKKRWKCNCDYLK
ncbi:MAG: outer membrane beta-barrel protein [Paludibacteraceae bacterium]